MTIPFIKLHVAGDDFILVEQEKVAPLGFQPDADFLSGIAQVLLDRRCGVGGNACIFVGPRSGEDGRILQLRAYRKDGAEEHAGFDGLWCAARWALDSGRDSGGTIQIMRNSRVWTLIPTDSRSFMAELQPPLGRKVTLIVDGHPIAAYVFDHEGAHTVALTSGTGQAEGPSPRRIRMALDSMEEAAIPIVVRMQSPDLVRLLSLDRADRITAAVCAAAALRSSGRMPAGTIAEWRGTGGAVSYADFKVSPGAVPAPGPSTLIDRGRFWLEWTGVDTLRIAGIAEYAFEGTYDY